MSSYHQQVVLVVMVMAFVSPWLQMGVESYSSSRGKIPNGHNVRCPGFPPFRVIGVGHRNIFGEGERNSFGRNFHSEGSTWTRSLCEMDSDGDGLTNGEELGDPLCEWSEGQRPRRTNRITHPGINNDRGLCAERLIGYGFWEILWILS